METFHPSPHSWTDQLGQRSIAGALDLGFEIRLAYPSCPIPIFPPGTGSAKVRGGLCCPHSWDKSLWHMPTKVALGWGSQCSALEDIGIGETGQPERHPTS